MLGWIEIEADDVGRLALEIGIVRGHVTLQSVRLQFTNFTWGHADRASPEFAEFLLDIAATYPAADTIHLILDNLSTHTRKAATDWFGQEDVGWLWSRFTVHHTPKHGSWLNQAEIEIRLFNRQCLDTRRISRIEQLASEANAWNERTNDAKTTIEWNFTRKRLGGNQSTRSLGRDTR